jgi:prepilin-type N-terminal cleavage/methylation domain-containing protein
LSRLNKRGFTLVEVALALLVVSIGLLALFSLFPAGLRLNKQSTDETQAALFAEEVLNGIRAWSTVYDWGLIRDALELEPPAYHIWYQADALIVEVTGNNWRTNRYVKVGPRGVAEDSRYADFGVRYRLEIDDIPGRPAYAVRLFVRPGEFGPVEPEYIFYTELYNHGQL